ncbi:IucA/IucC family siderophore biosynthesis protein [Amycolatopsis rhizosphaerae]|uniref:IucA/IucC family siderophore biosynthesis protein n=1 Tax=Amycolatopsis rhizosphaerae TaxID=2053003 RepID=A0A558BHU9_9PSEU|nr:IucA/IucC family protein [Amycolatopsis rhizosphaerae]TVT36094.1 IucA/IucC family siderophore biosynthesis protein [Amycolatopsis rhizosphaerae]
MSEPDLLLRVLAALLREDHLGLSSRGRPGAAPADGLPGGAWWCAPLPGGRTAHLPVRPDGFLSEHTVAEPLLVVTDPGGTLHIESAVEGALTALAPGGDADAEAGWAAFAEECRQAGETVRWQETAPARRAAGEGTGYPGLLRYEALAALRDHPVYPAGRCRWGMTAGEAARYAPEYLPRFRLRWTAVPRERVRLSASFADGLPAWWPAPAELGVAGAGEDHVVLPVHPLTADRGGIEVAGPPGPTVRPTLSTRTVALAGNPSVHWKLPLPTATLGQRNRRTIKPGTLADGERLHRLLNAVRDREPGLAARVLLADETRWADSDDDRLAVLIRHYPAEVAGDTLVPVAALLAPEPETPGRRVLDGLAGADPLSWFDGYLSVLLDWHVALWLRYGIALEAHQQNITIAQGPAGIRLVYKDNDSGRVDSAHASAALGVPVRARDFADRRITGAAPEDLADLFTTITLHLCVAALVVEETSGDRRRRDELFDLTRTRIEEAARRWCDPTDPASRRAAAVLRTRVLDADRLPVKAMVTAGTLLPKDRLGCTDINKYYLRTGPNYLAGSGIRTVPASSERSSS